MIHCREKLRACRLSILFLILVVIWIAFGCSFNMRTNMEPIAVTVTELSACRENGEPTKVFTPDENRIYVCGYIETLHPIDIEIYWYYENELVFRQIGEKIDSDFHSYVEPSEKVESFPVGNYRIDILVGGVVVKSAYFHVR